MKIAPFKVELWMNEHEDKAIYNTGETCVDSISIDELFKIAGLDKQETLNELTQKRLTYGHIFGNPRFKKGSLLCIKRFKLRILRRLMERSALII